MTVAKFGAAAFLLGVLLPTGLAIVAGIALCLWAALHTEVGQ